MQIDAYCNPRQRRIDGLPVLNVGVILVERSQLNGMVKPGSRSFLPLAALVD